MHNWTWVALALVAGCSTREPIPLEPEPQAASYCRAEGETCRLGGPACCDGFCSDLGYNRGVCRPLLDDGELCTEDGQCRAGVCTEYACGAPSCRLLAEACTAGSQCCSGHCASSTGRCAPPKPAGAPCAQDSECESQACRSDACAAVTGCFPIGGRCLSGSSCCSGYCEWVGYAEGFCAAPEPPGGFCTHDADCASGVCGDGYVCE